MSFSKKDPIFKITSSLTDGLHHCIHLCIPQHLIILILTEQYLSCILYFNIIATIWIIPNEVYILQLTSADIKSDPCESQPHKGHLTSKLKYRRFPPYLLCTLLLFPFHLVPPTVHLIGFFFCWIPCYFLPCCHQITTCFPIYSVTE